MKDGVVGTLESFHFVWPQALLLMLFLPVWWYHYAQSIRRQIEQQALVFSYTALVAQLTKVTQQGKSWKRLLYPCTLCFIFLSLIVALARPMVNIPVSVQSADVILVLDISLSMMANDIKPTRLEAAKRAAANFISDLPENIRVGLTVFAGDVYVLSPPTRKHAELIADLDALRQDDLKPRTEIGSALHAALQILAKEKSKAQRATAQSKSSHSKLQKEESPISNPTESNTNRDQAIVLLSDGDSHEGYPWDRAAMDAEKAHVRIDAIGIGSAQGGVIHYQGMELPVSFDERTLRQIAQIAHGQYFRAYQASDFQAAYSQIQAHTVHTENMDVELSFIFAGLALIGLLGITLKSRNI
jgi:Ca-activated chloride channel family protein